MSFEIMKEFFFLNMNLTNLLLSYIHILSILCHTDCLEIKHLLKLLFSGAAGFEG